MADEEIDKLVDRLVKDKEISESEGSALKKDMTGRADDLKKWIGEKIDQRVSEILDVMNLVTKDQVAGLTEEIKVLTKKIEKLEKVQARKAAETRKAAIEKKAAIETLPAVKESEIRSLELVAEPPAVEKENVVLNENKEMVMGSEG
jgi:polyhydroxyalkanoate synthesis regulator phasin